MRLLRAIAAPGHPCPHPGFALFGFALQPRSGRGTRGGWRGSGTRVGVKRRHRLGSCREKRHRMRLGTLVLGDAVGRRSRSRHPPGPLRSPSCCMASCRSCLFPSRALGRRSSCVLALPHPARAARAAPSPGPTSPPGWPRPRRSASRASPQQGNAWPTSPSAAGRPHGTSHGLFSLSRDGRTPGRHLSAPGTAAR